MAKFSPFRMQSFWPRLLLLGLALAVFGWNVAYKLSLYEQNTAHFHRVPSARMLSENERDTVKNPLLGGLSATPDSHAPLALFACAAFLLWSLCTADAALWSRARTLQPASSALPRAALSAFFFRPPPARL